MWVYIFMKPNEKKLWNGAQHEICVNHYYLHKVHIVRESFIDTPTRNVQYLPFIFSGFIFSTKDQYSPWQTEHLQNWKLPLNTLETFDIRLPKLQGIFVSLTKLSLFFLTSSREDCFSTDCYCNTIIILNIVVLEGTAILIKNYSLIIYPSWFLQTSTV